MSFANRRRPSRRILLLLLIVAALLPASLPLASAQESTEEPTGVPAESTTESTQEATQTPLATEETASPTPESTQAPTTETVTPTEEEPEATPPIESTQEPQPETTPPVESTQEPEPEATAPLESTEEPQPEITETPLPVIDSFSDDFAAFTGAGWTLSGWQGAVLDENEVLSAAEADASASIDQFIHADVQIDARVLVPLNSTLEIAFRADQERYLAVFASNGSSRLYRDDTLLDSYVMAGIDSGSWYTVSILAAGDTLVVRVNDIPGIVYTDETPLGVGSVAFLTGSTNDAAVFLDDVMATAIDPADVTIPVEATPFPVETEIPATPGPEVTSEITPETTAELTPEVTAEVTPEATAEVTPEATAEVTPEATAEVTPEATAEVTPELMADVAPNGLTAVGDEKLQNRVGTLMDTFDGDNAQEALSNATRLGFTIDSQERLLVTLVFAEGVTADDLQGLVSTYAGEVYSTTARQMDVFLPLEGIIAAANSDLVSAVQKPSVGVSTGPSGSDLNAPNGTAFSAGYDQLGVEDWHAAGYMGDGVRVGVIDVGFEGNISGSEYGCLSQRVDPVGAGSHGLNTVEVLCDIAPQADVFTFSASNYESLSRAIEQARSLNMDILVITVDLGATQAPGDGTGREDGDDPYTLLAEARADGVMVFAAGGNSGVSTLGPSTTRVTRYATFTVPQAQGSSVVLDLQVSAGDNIYISWNDWQGLGLTDVADPFAPPQEQYPGAPPQGNIEDFRFVLREDGTTGTLSTDNDVIAVSFDHRYRGEWRQDNPPAASLDVFQAYTSDPLSDNSCVVDGSGNSLCNIELYIERISGDSDVVMQIQIAPEQFIDTFADPDVIENQDSDIEFTGVTNATLETTGTLARPADSPDVIAVSGVCAYDGANYAALPDNSIGPIFGADGALPTIGGSPPFLRSEIKPDLASVSYVETSLSPLATDGSECDGTVANLDNIGGFGGSSAAAAHAAAIAAVARSHPTYDSTFDTGDSTGVDAEQDYMQQRTVDLPLDAPNGFDMRFGSGLSVLGDPGYTLSDTQNINLSADFLTCGGNAIYVGQAQLDGAQDGSFNAPYSQLGYAVEQAGANDCIVIMPGEYITPLYVDQSSLSFHGYDLVSGGLYTPTVFRVVGQYVGGADFISTGYTTSGGPVQPSFPNAGGLYLNNVDSILIEGFEFVGSSSFDTGVTPRQAVTMNNSTNVSLLNNTFSNWNPEFTPADWDNIIGMPLLVYQGSTITIQDNTFSDNRGGYVGSDFRAPTVAVVDAGSDSATVLINENKFENNTAIELGGATQLWPAILYSLNSYTDIVGNSFVGNNAGTLINGITADAAAAEELRIVSNIFLNNDFNAELNGSPSGQATGPLVHAYFVANLSFINNTAAMNDLGNSGANFGALLGRGDRSTAAVSGSEDGSIDNSTQSFDAFNNLVYDNTLGAGLFADPSVTITQCDTLAGGAGAIQNSWWHGNGGGGDCDDELIAIVNNNLVQGEASEDDPADDFLGSVNQTLDPQTDITYYALRQFPGEDIYSIGIDYSGITAGTDVDLSATPFDRGLFGQQRSFDVSNWPTPQVGVVDIGGFEFNKDDLVVDVYTPPDFVEDASPIVINLDNATQGGGFGELTYTLQQVPATFGTHCGTEYTQENNGSFIQQNGSNARLFYCPPRDFYTDNNTPSGLPDGNGDGFPGDGLDKDAATYDYTDDDTWPDYVIFTYTVVDESSIQDTGAVLARITATDDPALTAQIGDRSPDADDVFSITGNIGATINVRLRPFVTFDNFFFSEINNLEFGTIGSYQIDYPFTFSSVTQTDAPDDVVDTIDTSQMNTTGIITLTLRDDIIGTEEITYIAEDADANTTTNTITVNTISRIPAVPGLYDDSSFAFEYNNRDTGGPGEWEAVSDTDTINNTLHTSEGVNDVANFGFDGTSFVLYMQQEGRGGFWDLEINGDVVGGWTLLAGSSDVYISAATPGGFTCTTTSIANDRSDGLDKLTNRGRDPYTVTCESTNSQIHLVNIVNTEGDDLSVDAFSFWDSTASVVTGPLGPGFHDVNEESVRGIFPAGWVEESNRNYSNELAFVYADSVTPSDPFSFTIEGGTGFALGTLLDRDTATYTVCVTDYGANDALDAGVDPMTCQSFNNSPDSRTRTTSDTFRPFYGLNPDHIYQVDIVNLSVVQDGKFVFDSITVFEETEAPIYTILGEAQADEIGAFVLGNGIDDSWELDTTDRSASGGSLAEVERRTTAVGPYIAFQVDGSVDTIYYAYEDRSPTEAVMICVDRGLGVTTNDGDINIITDVDAAHGNCLQANLESGDTQQIGVDGALTPGSNILLTDGTIVIDESAFRGGSWGAASTHTIEIFSLLDASFTLDNVVAVGSTLPLPAGFFQEYTTAFSFWQSDFSTPAQVDTSDSSRTTDYTGDFTRVFGRGANRDLGNGVIYTAERGYVISFEFTGTGFAPLVRQERYGGAIEVCWQLSAQVTTLDQVPVDGTCQRFDTEDRRTTYGAPLQILGLANDTYTVTMQFLGDDFAPDALRNAPVWWFDALAVYDVDLTQLMPLSTGMTYEGRYDKRLEENLFYYIGEGWQTQTGGRARNFSAENYDTINREFGATVAFRVDDANAIVYTRDHSRRNSVLLVCATLESDSTQRHCSLLEHTSRGNMVPITIPMSADYTVGDYIVTITALSEDTFNFDAVQPVNINTALPAGLYDDNHPNIRYSYDTRNLVPNGDMENDNEHAPYWTNIGSPTISEQTSRPSYTGRYGWTITTAGADEGIASLPFQLEEDQHYTVLARVQIDVDTPGTVTMDIPGVTEFTPQTLNIADDEWYTLRFDLYIPTGSTADDALRNIQFTATAGTTFTVDDVQIVNGGGWQQSYERGGYGDDIVMLSSGHGAQAAFTFDGTGFAIGSATDREAGEMQVCWLLYTPPAVPDNQTVLTTGTCMTYQNEATRGQLGIMRLVTGLTDPGTDRYAVVIQDVEDGESVEGRDFGEIRNSRYPVGRLTFDFLYIFDGAPPLLTNAGTFNDDALIGMESIMQTLPTERWAVLEGRNYSEETYTAIIDSRGRSSRSDAGPVAAFHLEVPSDSQATFILDVNDGSRLASDQLLACAGGVEGAVTYNPDESYSITDSNGPQNCVLLDELTENRFITLNSTMLPLLADPTADGNPHEVILTLQTLTPGQFEIDGYQVLYGTTLPEGYYEETIGLGILAPQFGSTWELDENRNYSGGSALVSDDANGGLQFTFTGTGVSIVTALDLRGGTLDVNVTNSSTIDVDRTLDTSIGRDYGTAITIAGLPSDTYTVTITSTNDADEAVVLDAVEIYGTLQQLGSLYDDAEVDVNGIPLITYGPNNESWTVEVGRRARGSLNETLHIAENFGAVASFEIGATTPASGIVLYYDASKSRTSSVDVCFRDVGTLAETCNNIVLDGTGQHVINAPDAAQAPVPGNYYVSIINAESNDFALDAVQVLEDDLAEGIYNAPYVSAVGTLGGNTVLDGDVLNLPGNGDFVEFQMTGIAFSIVTEAISNSYDVCVATGTINTVPADCDVLYDSAAEQATAATYTGLHDGAGAAQTLNVRFINTDAVNNIAISEVHVLGDDDALTINDTERYENDGPQARYLPFSSFLLEADSRNDNSSAGSQHMSTTFGSLAYYEFVDLGAGGDTGFEFFRETSTRYGQTEVCYGAIGTDTLKDARDNGQCITVDNDITNAFQVGSAVTPATNYCAAPGCWVSLRNIEDRTQMPVDFLRLFDTAAPLPEGYYEETYGGLTFSDPNGLSTAGWEPIENRFASGGFEQRIIADAGTLDSSNGPRMSFIMDGTGFGVLFTSTSASDEVRLCYAAYTGSETEADALNGRCQRFDNENRRDTSLVRRSITGLPAGQYIVAIQMLPDNYEPEAHGDRDLPLEMLIDAVEIYGTQNSDWTSLNALTPGTRYETSYLDRNEDNNFVYVGSTWSTEEGRRASRYSGENYDTIREYGAGIVFHTNGADALTLYTRQRRGYAPLRFCVTPVDGSLTTQTGPTHCKDFPQEDGNDYQVPTTFRFEEFGTTPSSDYVVSIHTLGDGFFELDALELHTTGVLVEGWYEATDPSLYYDGSYENHIVNGDMEVDAHWTDVSLPTTTEQTNSRYEGRSGWLVEGDLNTGIQSEPFALDQIGTTYTAIARVQVDAGSVRLKLVEGAQFNSIAEFTEVTSGPTGRDWVTLRVDFTLANTYTDLKLQIVSNQNLSSFVVDDVSLNEGGLWQGDYSRSYTDDSAWRSQTHGASMQFSFFGTGFQVGAIIDRDGGEMEVCYVDSTEHTANGFDNASCFIYQQEDNRGSESTPRTITGLAQDTYVVRVRDVEDGFTVTRRSDPTEPRNSRYGIGQIAIDYVQIFNDTAMPTTPEGFYNEDAEDGSGNPYLRLFPSDQWGTFEGSRTARGFTEESYVGAIDERGRLDSRSGGQAAVLYVDVPAEGATVLLYTGSADRRSSEQFLACATDGMDGQIDWDGEVFSLINSSHCTLVDITDQDFIAVNSTDLGVTTPGVTRFMFTSLTEGYFKVDGFQVIHGTVLPPGIYDSALPDTLLDFDTAFYELPDRESQRCEYENYWCEDKDNRAHGESVLATRSADASLTFDILGAGFSIVTNPNRSGTDMLICYQQTPLAGDPNFPASDQVLDGNGNIIWDNTTQDLALGGTWCDVVTTDTDDWELRTPHRIEPRRGQQYGFAYYGLPYDNYSVLVRMIDQDAPQDNRDLLEIDAIVVFDDPGALTPLTAGFYDDAQATVRYEPNVFWEAEEDARSGPPRGPYALTEHTAENAGVITQMQVTGNAVTLYQTINTRNSADVQICVLVRNTVIHCTPEAAISADAIQNQSNPPAYGLAVELANFSQDGRRTYFTPIMFYGMGTGTHTVIIENRDHGNAMSVDAILVQD